MSCLTVSQRAKCCPNCGSEKHKDYYKSQWNSDKTKKTIEHTIICESCGFSLVGIGCSRKQAIRDVLSRWGCKEGLGYKYEYDYSKMRVEKTKPFKENINKIISVEENSKNLSVEKQYILRDVKALFNKFKNQNPKEALPCSEREVLKLYGFTNEEIDSLYEKPIYTRVFLKDLEEVFENLNNNVAVFTKDSNNVISKYTPIAKLEKTKENYDILKDAGFGRCAFILK